MYSHTFFVTSVRGNDLAPQIAAKASLRLFFAKMPLPAFFMASAFFLALSDCAFLPISRFSAFIFFNAAFVIVVFFVVVVGTVVFVVAIAFFLALSDCAFLPILLFSAFIFFNAAFVIV